MMKAVLTTCVLLSSTVCSCSCSAEHHNGLISHSDTLVSRL